MFGRDAELARIEQMLDRVAVGPSGLALDGSPGIGKTSLWREGVAGAHRRGYRVLSAAPGEPDQTLAFAGLGDLFDGLDPGLLAGLPEVQRHALAQALLLEAPGDAVLDPRPLARAVQTILRRLTAETPLVVAIDDAQWLDPASALALAFALTRIADEPIGVLLARRSASSGQLWAELSHSFADQGLTALLIEPLSLEAIDQLLSDRLEHAISRPLLARIHTASGGNPLYALAIARELQTQPAHGTAERDLPIPASLTDALTQRLAHLDQRTADALLAVAATSQPTLALLAAVIENFSLTDLDQALELDLIYITDDRVQFTHPLLASTHYTNTLPGHRRQLHRHLAEIIDDEEERAYHLARGAETPDRTTALTIEHAAGVAARRGAPLAAAALLEDAARLTPADSTNARRSRIISAAEHYTSGGDIPRARELLEALLPELPHDPTRARALLAMAWVRPDDFEVGVTLAREALQDAGDHDRLRSRIESYLAGALPNRGRFAEMWAHAQAALDSAERAGDPGVLALALSQEATSAFLIGRPVDLDALRRGIALEGSLEGSAEATTYVLPSTALGQVLFWSDDFGAARPVLARVVHLAAERGEESDYGALIFHLALLECHAGNLDLAQRHLTTAVRVARDQGSGNFEGWIAYGEALLVAVRGELRSARTLAVRATEIMYEAGDVLVASIAEFLLGSLELWLGEPPDGVHERLSAVREGFIQDGFGFVGLLSLGLWAVDIEALIACGLPGEAQPVADDLLARAQRSDNPNALAIAHRCQGLLLAAHGDITAAIDQMNAALAAHDRRPVAPEIARTLLEQGALQRRAKQKNAAKQSLEQALAMFEAMGAAMWSARTRDELNRIGLRRAVPSNGLTPAQERVAELVAAGMSNREVATTLYMSQRSVEAHLTKIYRELGVRSRSQLAGRMASDTTDARAAR